MDEEPIGEDKEKEEPEKDEKRRRRKRGKHRDDDDGPVDEEKKKSDVAEDIAVNTLKEDTNDEKDLKEAYLKGSADPWGAVCDCQ